MKSLTPEQEERYTRNIMLDQIGRAGQQKFLESRVLVVGAGGLGSPVLMYLAAAGVGTIGVVDGDIVELSNLQRQIVHTDSSVGNPKVESARLRMLEINPEVQVEIHEGMLSAENGPEIFKRYEFVVEATDNFTAKFLVNDICVHHDIPFCHGGILEFTGQVLTVIPGKSCCYRCLFQTPPPAGIAESCSRAGVLGAVAGIVGSIQAAETLKFLAGADSLLMNTLLTVNALTMDFRRVPVRMRYGCCLK